MKIQECFYELRQEDDERKSIADHVRTARIIHSAERTLTRFAWFPTLAW